MKKPPDSQRINHLLAFLQRPRAIITLLCLYHARNKGLDKLLQEIGGSKRTGMTRINELHSLGLVSKHTEEHGRKTLYRLSEDGRKIAEKLGDILDHWKNKDTQQLSKVKEGE